MKFLGIIPARYASTRFPGKPLVKIHGTSMIMRVYERASEVLDNVYVATDDKRIFDEVVENGGKALYTSANHQSGTDRVNEAAQTLQGNGLEFDVVINIQGDEPFIHPNQIKELMSCFENESNQLATLVKKITSLDELFNSNTPKVVVDSSSNAMYFSRSPIPFYRNDDKQEWLKYHSYFKHIGMYAYRVSVLKQITSIKPSSLEVAESLEQLRWLENGYKIKVAVTETESYGIDTPEDLNRILELNLLKK